MGETQTVDIRTKVEYVIPREEVHVTTDVESLCHGVQLKGHVEGSNDDEQAQPSRATMRQQVGSRELRNQGCDR